MQQHSPCPGFETYSSSLPIPDVADTADSALHCHVLALHAVLGADMLPRAETGQPFCCREVEMLAIR